MNELTIDKFLAIKEKKIICFGSGSYFKVMYYDMKKRNADFKIEGVIDNNPDKIGKRMVIAECSIPIVSIDFVMKQYAADEIVLLITTTFYKDVVQQLRKIKYFDKVKIFSYYELMRNETPAYESLETSISEAVIPKKIHYCWFGNKQMPLHLQKNVDGWKKICPDYEFICWNEKNYDISKTAYTLRAYENKKWGYLPDYVRLDIIHQEGGIYLDTDVELVQSLNQICCNYAFFGTEIAGGINEGSGFGAVKGYPLIRELMEVYEKADIDDPVAFMASSGREIEVFHRHGFLNNGRYQVLDGAAIYPYQVMTAMIRETGECMRTNATIAIHHFEGSWC